MVVRDRTGRNRYIAFVVAPPADRRALLAALRESPERLHLVEYADGRGLVQCAHTAKDATVAFLSGLRVGDATVRTVGTSGTIRRAKRKYLEGRATSRGSP